MAARRPLVVVGLRAHLGAADAVTLTGIPDDPIVVDRRSIDLRPKGQHGAYAHPYGLAGDAAPEDRARVLQEGLEITELAATDALLHLTSELGIEAGGVVVSRDVLLRIPIDRVLASMSLYHTASGAVYQRAMRGALDNLGLPCTTVEFSVAESHQVWPLVSALGKQVGPPWRKDHKFAAVAAWLAALDAEREAVPAPESESESEL